MSGRYLVINADDFGMCKSANDAIFDLFKGGHLLSSTIMMPCPGAEDAVNFAIENPEYAIGIHLTLTNEWKEKWPWGPISDGKSIRNEFGRMWPENEDFEAHCTYKESIAEVIAQIKKAEDMGMKPSHIDNHMGSLYGMNGKYVMLPKVFKVCKNMGYPFRMCIKPKKEFCPTVISYTVYKLFCYFMRMLSKIYKVYTPDYLVMTDQVDCLKEAETYEEFRDNFLNLHGNIPEGITETFIHPAMDTDEMKSITGTWQRRYWEYLLMKDPKTHEFFKEKGIELISYRDIVNMRKNKLI